MSLDDRVDRHINEWMQHVNWHGYNNYNHANPVTTTWRPAGAVYLHYPRLYCTLPAILRRPPTVEMRAEAVAYLHQLSPWLVFRDNELQRHRIEWARRWIDECEDDSGFVSGADTEED